VPLSPREKVERGRALKSTREAACKIWLQDTGVLAAELQNRLKELGYVVGKSTVQSWISRWRRQAKRQAEQPMYRLLVKIDTSTRYRPIDKSPVLERLIPLAGTMIIPWKIMRGMKVVREGKPAPPKPEAEVTWRDVVKAVPDRTTLANLVLDGFLQVFNEKNKLEDKVKELAVKNEEQSKNIELLTKERINLMQQLNHYIAKEKGVVFTIDQAKNILVPKEKGT